MGAAETRADELVIVKPFGPSVSVPDPAKGYNGWYTGEAGITETLFNLDFNMRLDPCLAKGIDGTDSGSWRLRLRKGVSFHNGTPLTAEVVRKSLTRFMDPESPVFNKRLQQLLDIKQIRVEDDHTLEIQTHNPNASLPYDLTLPGTAITVPSRNGKTIVGTGPFLLEKVFPKEKIVVSSFNDYWRGRPGIDRVQLNILSDPAARMLAFESGRADLAIHFPESDAERLKAKKDVSIIHAPTTRLCFLFVRTVDGPLSDPLVRKALNYAINREEIVNTVLHGVGGEVAGSVFPGVLPWHHEGISPYPYDPARALALLEQAGIKDTDGDGILEREGRPFRLNIWTYEGRSSLRPTLELIQTQLQSIGILTRMRVTKRGSPINLAMRRGEVHLNLQMWNVAPHGDPDYFVSHVFTTEALSNIMGYRNSELDALAKKGKASFDIKERQRIYRKIQEILYKDSPVISLFYKHAVCAVRRGVKGYKIHPAERAIVTHRIHGNGFSKAEDGRPQVPK